MVSSLLLIARFELQLFKDHEYDVLSYIETLNNPITIYLGDHFLLYLL